jgi:membrane protein
VRRPGDEGDAGARPGSAAVGRFVDAILGLALVRYVQRVLAAFDAAGGGLLAGGLAYSALFALVPGLLLIVGIVGIVVSDPGRRAEVLTAIGGSVPPLQTFAVDVLPGLRDGAGWASLLGLIGLIWGASRFYASLDDAFARIFRDAPVRGLVSRSVRGIAAVLLLLAMFVAVLAISSIASIVTADVVLGVPVGSDARSFWQVASPVLTTAISIVSVGAIYRFVPARRIPLDALAVPAIVVGVALAAFTELFAFVGPRLIGSASQFGQVIAAIFGLMIWLGTGFQALLLGAAWVHQRLLARGRAADQP